MNQQIHAIFEHGVFRPEVPVNIADGQRVTLNVHAMNAPAEDLAEIADLIDADYTESCRLNAQCAPSLEEVRAALSAFEGSLADRIAAERDER